MKYRTVKIMKCECGKDIKKVDMIKYLEEESLKELQNNTEKKYLFVLIYNTILLNYEAKKLITKRLEYYCRKKGHRKVYDVLKSLIDKYWVRVITHTSGRKSIVMTAYGELVYKKIRNTLTEEEFDDIMMYKIP